MAQSRAGWAVLIGWLAALVGPPVIAGSVWQQFATRHLALAVAAGVLYWAAVAVAGFASGVAGDVAGRWRKRVADRLDLTIQRRVSGFEKRYRNLVLANLRFIDLKGLATVGPFTPELDAVFVDVALVPRPPHEIAPGVVSGAAPASGRRAIDEFIGRTHPALLAVVGGPGSGKTTLLRHTARQACTRKRGRRGPGRDLPILLYLRDHVAAITSNPEAAPLAALLRSTLGDIAVAEPPGWLEEQLRGGRCLVLLDGLDEVARQEDRAKVAAWAEKQVRSFPGNDFLITSRPHGYRSAPIEGAEVVQVCGFSGVQVEGFVRSWYRVAERHATRAEGAEIDIRAGEAADDLLQRLDQSPALHELAANPLLLTMIANVHRYRGALPGSRAALYSEICQVMFWRRQEAKNLASEMTGEKKETVLRALAYAMMQRRISDLPERELLDEIRPVLRRLSRKVTPESFVADAGSNGLLVERETEQYSFAHHTFQEYLAAAHIRDKGLVHVLADNVSDPWWRETTLLYAARADADPLVHACLDAGTVMALALAFDCADQDSELDASLRDRLDQLLASGTDPRTGPERRLLIAGILLTRHVRQQVTAADGTRVCARPVNNDLYRIFLADTHVPPPDARMDEGTAGTVAGLRSSDAVMFTQWANSVTGGSVTYRLPADAALNDPAVQRSISAALPPMRHFSAWAAQDSGAPETLPGLWVPSNTPHPWKIDSATLTARLENDISRSPSTLVRLLILRSIIAVMALNRILAHASLDTLDQAHGQTRSLASNLVLAVSLDHGRDPARAGALHQASERTGALGRALSLALDGVHDRRDFDREFALDRARDLARDRGLDAALYLALDRPIDLDRALALDQFASPFSHVPALELADDSGASYLLERSRTTLGRSLSEALMAANDHSFNASNWAGAFLTSLAGATGIGDSVYTPDPDTLDAKLTWAVEGAGFITDKLTWAHIVAERLVKAARPVFSRQAPPTTEAATRIRMAALCLAGEADGNARHELGEAFRDIAAGITLLEERQTGRRLATETIVLTID